MSCSACVQYEDDHDGQHAAAACECSDEQDWSELRPLRGLGKPDDLCACETDFTHTGQGSSSCSKTKDRKERSGKKQKRRRMRRDASELSSGRNYKTKTRKQEEEDEEEETQRGSNHRDAGRNQALHVHPSLAEAEEAGDAPPDGVGASGVERRGRQVIIRYCGKISKTSRPCLREKS